MEALKEVQRIEYERGGYLAWGIAEGIDLAASKVKDLPTIGGYARMQLEKTWMSAELLMAFDVAPYAAATVTPPDPVGP